MKKILIVLLILLITVCAVLPISAAQTATVKVTPSEDTVEKDSIVTFTVKVSGVSAAKSVGFVLVYDELVFDFVSAEWTVSGAAISDVSGGTAVIAYTSARSFDGDIFKFTLKVKKNVPLDYNTVSVKASIKNGVEEIQCKVTSCDVLVTDICRHNFSSWVNYNSNTHKKTCDLCSAVEFTPHLYTNSCDPSCDDCGYIRTVTHTYVDWVYDANSHWYECLYCQAKKELASHIPGAATDSTPQVCTVCGYVLQQVVEHTHKINTELSRNGTYHWYECEGCKKEFEKMRHQFDAPCDGDCNECGYKRPERHEFSTSEWLADDNGHWNVCQYCGKAKKSVAHSPGASVTETAPQTCTVCGYVIDTPVGHKHSVSEEWEYDGSSHWHACRECDAKFDIKVHQYDSYCDDQCDICGNYRQVCHQQNPNEYKADASGHWLLCIYCGQNAGIGPHVPSSPATDEMPQLCTECGYEITPRLNHTHSYSSYYFSDSYGHRNVCGCGHFSNTVNHEYDLGKITEEATAEKNGKKIYTCNICKYEKEEEYKLSVTDSETSEANETKEPDLTDDPVETTLPELTNEWKEGDGTTEEFSPHTTVQGDALTSEENDGGSSGMTNFIPLVVGLAIGAAFGILAILVIKRKVIADR